jgi:membrane protease YdiL (CAAX protease family)
MSGIAPATRVSRVALFLAITIGFSWLQWIAVIASQHGWIATAIPLTPLAQFGPLAGSLCVLWSAEERSAWMRSIMRWRVAPLLALSALFGVPAIFMTCMLVTRAITGASVALPSWRAIAVVSAGMFVLGGGIGEESGWRGFLLPELRKSFGPVSASFVVAIAWFTWHLPLIWVSGASQQDLQVPMFAIGIVSYTFIMTWLAERSSNSTLLAMLFHASANTTFWVAMSSIRHTPQERVFLPLYLGALALAAIVAAAYFNPRPVVRYTAKLPSQ